MTLSLPLGLCLSVLSLLLHSVGGEDLNLYTRALRNRFEASFYEKCSKYSFVDKWVGLLENSTDRYITFVYHEDGLRNGGLGDRIGGLITATAIALRTNRTLLIESHNDFNELFRPYHPKDIEHYIDKSPKYTWDKKKWRSWSNYDPKFADNDDTEYDLYFCINCVAWRNPICGMDAGDVSQQHIKLRGNRAFLCKWATHKDTVAHKEILQLLQVSEHQLKHEVNLWEVSGCMLRLAMWPTERLWGFVDKEVEKHLKQLENVVSPSKYTQYLHLLQKESNEALSGVDISSIGPQIAAHFRCGDNSFLHPDQAALACVHDVDGSNPHTESSYMGSGTPDMLGNCVSHLIANHTDTSDYTRPIRHRHQHHHHHHDRHLQGENSDRRYVRSLQSNGSDTSSASTGTSAESSPSGTDDNTLSTTTTGVAESPSSQQPPFLFIASDNLKSAEQIQNTSHWPLTYINPKGCHIELNPSFDCSMFTIGYWLMLASSDYIVTQTDKFGSPISAFSRYAAVYGLKGNSLRDSKNCQVVQNFKDLGKRWNGNYFCD